MMENTLRQCYLERSHYYLRLEREMLRMIEANNLGHEVIETFCSRATGDLPLDTAEDYNNVVTIFQSFVDGVAWVLDHYSASNWFTPLASMPLPDATPLSILASAKQLLRLCGEESKHNPCRSKAEDARTDGKSGFAIL